MPSNRSATCDRRHFLSLVLPFAPLTSCGTSKTSAIRPARVITIDPNTQRIARAAIEQCVEPLRLSTADVDGAMVILDNATSGILAYVATVQRGSQYDNLRAGRKDLGSTVKPFLYATALETGVITPHETFRDAPRSFGRRDNGRPYQVSNYADRYTFTDLTIDEAIARSSNVVAGTVYERINSADIRRFFTRLHLGTSYSQDLLFAGRWNAPLVSMCAAYTVFVNGGRYRPATFGEPYDSVDVFHPEFCSVVSKGMRRCIRSGTGSAAADLADCLQGKTGSSTDALAVAQTPIITGAVWIGRRDSNLDLHRTGGSLAMPAIAMTYRQLRKLKPEWFPAWDK